MDGKPMTAKRFISTRFFVPSICTQQHKRERRDNIRSTQQHQRCVTQRPLKLMLHFAQRCSNRTKRREALNLSICCAACNNNFRCC